MRITSAILAILVLVPQVSFAMTSAESLLKYSEMRREQRLHQKQFRRFISMEADRKGSICSKWCNETRTGYYSGNHSHRVAFAVCKMQK